MGVGRILCGIDRTASKLAFPFEPFLRRREVVPLLIIFFWACAVLPNLTVRSFIWEEGTNAEIARDVLANGHFFEPFVYGIRWHEKPSLLAWLIAGIADITGEVDEWSARLPVMVSVLLTALLVQMVTQRYASLNASLFAALSFLFCPLLLQKLTIAEPDTIITLLSFAALLLWWNGVASGRTTIMRWIGCGALLAVLAMAKGPQPAGFFALGVLAYTVVERRWRELPGWFLCMTLPIAATIVWGGIVYQPGDEASWVMYTRLHLPSSLSDYIENNSHNLAQLILELMPAILLLPRVPWPWRRDQIASAVPPIVAPMLLYSVVCTAFLVVWPGFNSRYAMPIAPSVAVLAGIGWDTFKKSKSKYSVFRRGVLGLLCLFIFYQFVLVTVIMPLFSDRFGVTRSDAKAIEQKIRAAPAPLLVFCANLDTNQLFYLRVPFRCLDLTRIASLTPPAWLVTPQSMVPEVLRLRPGPDVRIELETSSGPELTAMRLDEK
jgi:4-amino-4-deoxy-L-arabinose transferase-like glycosyltransferase